MPSLSELAGQCGVSRTTMWRAVGLLKEEGLVYTKKNGLIFSGPEKSVQPAPPRPLFAWERLAGRLSRDILSGSFGRERLPPASKLALRYNVARNTMRKSLDHLVQERSLVREGSGYAPARPSSRHHRPAVVFVGEGEARSGVHTRHILVQRLVETQERECLRLGYDSRSVAFDSAGTRGRLDFVSEVKSLSEVRGYIVTLWAIWEPLRLRRWAELLLYLAETRAPVIIIDQIGTFTFPPTLMRHGNVRIFRVAAVRAGEMMAEFLLRRGHTHIAYVTPHWSSQWAQQRYHGLRRTFDRCAPAGSSVELFASHETFVMQELMLILLQLSDDEIASLFAKSALPYSVEEMQGQMKALRNNREAEQIARAPAADTSRRVARSLIDIARGEPETESYDFYLDQLIQYANTRADEHHQIPLFEKAHAAFAGDVWVCSSDRTAHYAIQFLRSRNRKVPGDVSVVGFDNVNQAYEQHLTTYDFDMNGMMQAALVMIADPRRLRDYPQDAEFDGYVVERLTTRR